MHLRGSLHVGNGLLLWLQPSWEALGHIMTVTFLICEGLL